MIQSSGKARENATANRFLSNGGTELNTTSQVYDLDYRSYDPVLGRMNQIDPMADKFSSITPFNFALNDPVFWKDPGGASSISSINSVSSYQDYMDQYMAEM